MLVQKQFLDTATPSATTATTKYTVVRKAALKRTFELASKQVAALEVGDVVEVAEERTNHLGQIRVRIVCCTPNRSAI